MKAVINARYGSPNVLEIRQTPTPQPKAGEILIKVYATTVSRTDCGNSKPST
jgi:NADPH:quinone reductase-like Zn-dependent oxidoreductase